MKSFQVGLMALFSILATVYMSFRITTNQSGFGEYITYKALSQDASGLFKKAPVRIAGIPVGRIISIDLQGRQAIITFEVRKSTAVTEGTLLRIRSVGFLGEKYPELIIGPSDKVLPEFSVLETEEEGTIEDLAQDASKIMRDVKGFVNEVRDNFMPENSPSFIQQTVEDFQIIFKNMNEATQLMRDATIQNREKLSNIMDALEQFAMTLEYQSNKANGDSAMADVDEILANTKVMTDDLRKVIFDLKHGKGSIGKLLREDKIVDEVTQTISGVNKLVNKMNTIRTELDMFMGTNTSYGADSYLNLKIHPSPERLYLLGLTTSEYSNDRERTIIREINGIKTVENETIRKKDPLRFNFQLGRQYNNLTFRGGLIESTGGLGIDYTFSKWDQNVAVELFDHREEIGPNLRISSDLRIWNMLYGKISLEDILSDQSSSTISVGLKFVDEDIRSLAALFIR